MINKKIKIINTSILATLLAVTPILQASETQTSPSIDTYWGESALKRWHSYGVVKGRADGDFAPQDPVTRAEFATFMNRIFQLEPEVTTRVYTDLVAGAWYEADVNAITSNGLMYVPGQHFNPQQSMTRQEVAYSLSKLYHFTNEEAYSYPFTDADDIEAWAEDSIYALTSQSYLTGRADGSFDPQGDITRAEFVAILDRMTNNYIHEPGTYTHIETGNLVINSSDVTLQNVTINGNLYITDAAQSGDIHLQSVKVTGNTYIETGNILADGTFEHIQLGDVATFTLQKGRIDTLTVLSEDTHITLETGTLTNHLILAKEATVEGKGHIGEKISYQKAPMNIVEVGVLIGDTFVPAQLSGTEIVLDLYQLLAQTSYTDVMQGLMVTTDVEGAYIQGKSTQTLQGNTYYTFEEANQQLGMIEEVLGQMGKESDELQAIITQYGITADGLFALLKDQTGEISIRYMIEAFDSYKDIIEQMFDITLPTSYTFERHLHYGDETPIPLTITLKLR